MTNENRKGKYAGTRKAYYDANREALVEKARERRKLPEVKALITQRRREYIAKNREKLNAEARLRYALLHPPKPKPKPKAKPAPKPKAPQVAVLPQTPHKSLWREVRRWTRAEWRDLFGGRETYQPRIKETA